MIVSRCLNTIVFFSLHIAHVFFTLHTFVLDMGIPKYFRWVVKKYPDVLVSEATSSTGIRISTLYLDANCLIHPCVRETLDEYGPTLLEEHFQDYRDNKYDMVNCTGKYSKLEKKMFENIVQYIYYLCTFAKPTQLLFVAIDGIAPRAKMKQQRSRRYRSQKEKQLLRSLYAKHGTVRHRQWDTNAITPGTTFMLKLSDYLQKHLPQKIKPFGCRIVLSDTSRPGEGEHKIMEHIRSQKGQFDQKRSLDTVGLDSASVPASTSAPTTSDTVAPVYCIYGLDADLIMLALCSQSSIFLLRESVHYGGVVDSEELLLFDIAQFKQNM